MDLNPSEVSTHSNKKVWWKCPDCGMSWEATIYNRIKGSGCPYDAGRLPIPGMNDLATIAPHVADTWDYESNGNLLPEQYTAHSHKKAWWKCHNCGMLWKARIDNRVNGNGCPYCAGKLPIPGKTDLVTIAPGVAALWDHERNGDLMPEQFTAHSSKIVWWKCPNCGKSWKAPIYNRINGHGCPYDAGQLPIRGVNDLTTLAPLVAASWDHEKNGDFNPEQFTAHTKKKFFWKCPDCGMSWKSSIAHRVNGCGCSHCAKKYKTKSKSI